MELTATRAGSSRSKARRKHRAVAKSVTTFPVLIIHIATRSVQVSYGPSGRRSGNDLSSGNLPCSGVSLKASCRRTGRRGTSRLRGTSLRFRPWSARKTPSPPTMRRPRGRLAAPVVGGATSRCRDSASGRMPTRLIVLAVRSARSHRSTSPTCCLYYLSASPGSAHPTPNYLH